MNKKTIIILGICACCTLCFIFIIAGLIIFGTSPLPEGNKIDRNSPFKTVHYDSLPEKSYFLLQDQGKISYREYPADSHTIMIFIHGETGSSRNMHPIAQYMKSNNIAHGFTLDIRGHGESGEKGKIDYIGQLEKDLAEIINRIRDMYPKKKIIVVGFSAGGGFAIRFGGSQYGRLADSYIFLTPFLHPDSPVTRASIPDNKDQWKSIYFPRYAGLIILNLFGITSWNTLPVVEYRIPGEYKEDYTAVYSYNLSENFRPHKDYILDIRELKRPALLFAGKKDEMVIAENYISELSKNARNLSIILIDDADHYDMILNEDIFEKIAVSIR